MAQPWGRILGGNEDDIRRSYDLWNRQPVDESRMDGNPPESDAETTVGAPVSVEGPGTFFGRATRRLTFLPAQDRGWRFERQDLPGCLPISASVGSVWTTVRNIVLCSGSPHNYMRMVEHIVALRCGLGLDHVLIQLDSGDPPLLERGSLDLVEAVDRAGIVPLPTRARHVTVKEPVTLGGPRGSFLTLLPAEGGSRRLTVDCAVDFRSAIGRQRIRFVVQPDVFRHGAFARTNTTLATMLYCKTVGKIFADVRNLGYTTRNILVAGRWRYLNQPRLIHEGKSLEAVWHRAALDLLAALALIDRGRFAGTVISYKAGHALDVELLRALYQLDLMEGA